MKSGLSRIVGRIVALVAAVAVGLTGVVDASADEPDGAAAVRQLHDDLAMADEAGDLPATQWTLNQLRPVLRDMATGARYAADEDARSLADQAGATTAEALSQVNALYGGQKGDLPPVPALLNLLLQKLLALLSHLLDQLLGTVALPV